MNLQRHETLTKADALRVAIFNRANFKFTGSVSVKTMVEVLNDIFSRFDNIAEARRVGVKGKGEMRTWFLNGRDD